MEDKIKKILEQDINDISDEEYEMLEDRLKQIEEHLDYCDRRDRVCLAIDGEQERAEYEGEYEIIYNYMYKDI